MNKELLLKLIKSVSHYRCVWTDVGNWMPIDLNKIYQVGTCSFIAHDKDGFTTFGKVLKERGGIYLEYQIYCYIYFLNSR